MVHHSCYCNISFKADRLFFFGGVLRCLPRPLHRISRWALLALREQLCRAGSAKAFAPQGCADFCFGPQEHFQPHALELGGSRHGGVRLFWLFGSDGCRARCAGLLGGYCLHSVSSCAVRAALNPWPLSVARTSASLLNTTLRRMRSIWEGPGMLESAWGLGPRARSSLAWSRLRNRCRRYRISWVCERWWKSVLNYRMIINLLRNLLPILPNINIHLYQHLSSMANVLPTEEGMLVSGIRGTMHSSSKFGLLRQPN